jgi:hypothetical protein
MFGEWLSGFTRSGPRYLLMDAPWRWHNKVFGIHRVVQTLAGSNNLQVLREEIINDGFG